MWVYLRAAEEVGLFRNTANQQQQQLPETSGGLFGGTTNTTQQPATGGSLFGNTTNTQQPAAGGGLLEALQPHNGQL